MPHVPGLQLVFLPATAPGDTTYGVIPDALSGFPGALLHTVQFPTMVWYNATVRAEAIAQIRALNGPPVILVGFSKSGLGAWNIAREIPDLIAATMIFDAPMCHDRLPPWGTAPFYADDEAWRKDLPSRQLASGKGTLVGNRPLILVSGAAFHADMSVFSATLFGAKITHHFIAGPERPHHWNSGWIEDALERLLGAGNAGIF